MGVSGEFPVFPTKRKGWVAVQCERKQTGQTRQLPTFKGRTPPIYEKEKVGGGDAPQTARAQDPPLDAKALLAAKGGCVRRLHVCEILAARLLSCTPDYRICLTPRSLRFRSVRRPLSPLSIPPPFFCCSNKRGNSFRTLVENKQK